MVAARRFVEELAASRVSSDVARVTVALHGSLALTGKGHGTDGAVLLGLMGFKPATADPDASRMALAGARASGRLPLGAGLPEIGYREEEHLAWRARALPQHPNAVTFVAEAEAGERLLERRFFSVGGGFVLREDELTGGRAAAGAGAAGPALPHPFDNAEELLEHCQSSGLDVCGVMLENEAVHEMHRQGRDCSAWASMSGEEREEVYTAVLTGLNSIWLAMRDSIRRGCTSEQDVLPGPLKVARRAPTLFEGLVEEERQALAAAGAGEATADLGDWLLGALQREAGSSSGSGGHVRPRAPPAPPRQLLQARPTLVNRMAWVDLFALAVNEENAAGGRVVTAPTNGASGVVPAVLQYWLAFMRTAHESCPVRTHALSARVAGERPTPAHFLLTAGAVGLLCKHGASISGAQGGCQAEVGSACSMSAAALCAVLGGSPGQVENAAEIGLEHNLGLTCDPIAGQVQIPCIERNSMAAVKAINAANLALRSDPAHSRVSLDSCIAVMKATGDDMSTKYKETSTGGLAAQFLGELGEGELAHVGQSEC